jgi:uncharacterized protein (DUF58 family)
MMAENLQELGDVHDKVVESAVKEGVAHHISSKRVGHDSSSKGKLLVNFPQAVSEFENAMHKLPVKRILYKSVFRGKGLEFESYRLHGPEDDASLIDWRASLRANEMLAKQYVEERQLNVYFLIDVSSSMLFGSSDKLKAEYAAEFVASLSHLIVGSGDNIGMVMFNDDVVKILHPSCSKNQFALFTKFLSDSKYYGGGFDLNKAIEFVLRTVRSSYTVFIVVSDFIKTKKDSLDSLRLIGTRFETFAVMIRDQLDENLPKTSYQFSVQDPYSGRQMILDPAIAAERYRKNVIRQKGMVKEMLKRSRVDLLELMTDKGFTMPVSTFLRSRAVGARV